MTTPTIRRRPRLAAALLLLLPALIAPACTLQQDHKRMARAFIDGRTPEEALAAAAPDFTIRIGDESTPPIARDQFREMTQWDATLNADADIRDIHARGQTAVAKFHESNDFSRLLGHPGWNATMTFWFDEQKSGGLISEALYVPAPDNQPWQPYLEPALPYLRANYPDQLAAYYPDDTLVMTAESARAWRRVLTDWRKSTDTRTPEVSETASTN